MTESKIVIATLDESVDHTNTFLSISNICSVMMKNANVPTLSDTMRNDVINGVTLILDFMYPIEDARRELVPNPNKTVQIHKHVSLLENGNKDIFVINIMKQHKIKLFRLTINLV